MRTSIVILLINLLLSCAPSVKETDIITKSVRQPDTSDAFNWLAREKGSSSQKAKGKLKENRSSPSIIVSTDAISQLIERGELERAEEIVERQLKTDPSSISLKLLQAKVMTISRRYHNAISLLASIHQQSDHLDYNEAIENDIQLLKSICLIEIGKTESGIQSLNRLIAENPYFMQPYIVLTNYYLRNEQEQIAYTIIKKAMDLDSNNKEVIIAMTNVLIVQQNLNKAQDYIELLNTKFGDEKHVRFLLANLFTAREEFDQALAALKELQKNDELSDKTPGLMGYIYFRLGLIDKATYFLNLALKNNPYDIASRLYLGLSYLKDNEKSSEAKRLFNEVKMLSKKNGRYYEKANLALRKINSSIYN